MRLPFATGLRDRRPRTDASDLAVARHRVEQPVGAVIMFAGDLTNTALEAALINQGWLPCDGRQVPLLGYQGLFAAIGMIYTPSGTPSGQFCVPDYQGQFLRGLATSASQDPGFAYRVAAPGGGPAQGVGSSQTWMVQTHEHDYQALSGTVIAEEGPTGATVPATPTATTGLLNAQGTGNLTGEETRPQNIYINFLIKAASVSYAIGVVR